MASVSLEPYVGPCVVADVRPRDGAIRPSDLPPDLEADVRRTRRVLLRPHGAEVPPAREELSHATAELADWLGERGVCLCGIDTDSMDASDSKKLPAHHALLERGIAIVEGLDLSGAPPGVYELVALPLPLAGADASPVRAVLIER